MGSKGKGAGAAPGAAEITQFEPDQGNTCDREPQAFQLSRFTAF